MYVEKNIISPQLMRQNEELGFLFFHKRDAYDKMNHGEVVNFLNASLKQAVKNVLNGDAYSVEEAVKPIIAKVRTRESYDKWIGESYPRKYFVPSLKTAENDAFIAQRIITESVIDPAKAKSLLTDAKFSSYLDKSFVESLMKHPANNTNLPGTSVATTTANASIGGGIVEWAKTNPKTALGLSAASVFGIFYLANHHKPAPQTLIGLNLN